MKFRRVSDWAEVSECNGYSVCAAKVLGKYTFQAWRVPATLLGTRNDAESCRELCREHAKNHKQRLTA